jgi:predicted 3-demethylubiquinone-9 3-methyltransferase (glyoxalase superfamily)
MARSQRRRPHSAFIDCTEQALEEGLTDRYGLSWQIIPSVLGKLLQSPDAGKSNRSMRAMPAMDKLDIRALHDAFDGR